MKSVMRLAAEINGKPTSLLKCDFIDIAAIAIIK